MCSHIQCTSVETNQNYSGSEEKNYSGSEEKNYSGSEEKII